MMTPMHEGYQFSQENNGKVQYDDSPYSPGSVSRLQWWQGVIIQRRGEKLPAPQKSASPLFPLGTILCTPGAQDYCSTYGINMLELVFKRHNLGDWGDLDAHDNAANNRALKDGSRIFSAYQYHWGKLWVITEADRSATTVLLPDEY